MGEGLGIGWEAVAIAVFVALVAMAPVRSSSRWRGALLRITVLVVALLATVGAFRFFAEHEQATERRAWLTRSDDLRAHALAPGTNLACLDGDAGEAVEAACEKTIFAGPGTTASAVSYVAARLALLEQGIVLAIDDPSISGLRRMLELDRYGIAAHVLATRDACSVEACPAFAWIADPTALKANLQARVFDAYVQRYASAWVKEPKSEAPNSPAETPQAEAAPPEPHGSTVSSRWDFPSAASIPPVSIMNKEPPRPAQGEVGVSQPIETQQPQQPQQLPVPPRRPQTQGAAPR